MRVSFSKEPRCAGPLAASGGPQGAARCLSPRLTARLALAALTLAALALARSSYAIPPKPGHGADDTRALLQLRADERAARKWGLDQPHPSFAFDASKYGSQGAKRNALVILIDFSDKLRSVPPENIESLLFSSGTYSTGSMRDYYRENSYGLLDVQGAVVGWVRSEREYSYYVDGSRGLNFQNGDHNARGMAEEALRLADPLVDFSQFDNDGPDGVPSSGDDDGYIDALLIVHAGSGSEETLSPNDILSHQSYFTSDVEYDGVRAILYTTEPEDGRVGVFCHEFGHTIGLPDLYDISDSPGPSVGLGDWSLMATGVWLNDGRTPAHLDAWSKATLGFVDAVVPDANVADVMLPPVEEDPVVYKMWTNGRPGEEYYLAELRTRTGFDAELPGTGVLVYHVDESVRLQDDPARYKVALVQADGRRQLETQYGNYGDTGDPFPGATTNRSFTPFSDPYSLAYDGHDSQVWMTDIGVLLPVGDDATMGTFDLQVETEPAFVLESLEVSDPEGNGDGIVEIGEPGLVSATVRNIGIDASQVEVRYEALAQGIRPDEEGEYVGTVEADSAFQAVFGFTWGPLPEVETVMELPFNLSIDYDGTEERSVAFSTGAGSVVGLVDGFEGPEAAWTHHVVSDERADAWALTTARANSGTSSWVFGGTGGYPNLADGALVSRPVLLGPNSQLVFFYWAEVESLGSSLAWDGARVELSSNGGPWRALEPAAGYPFTVIEFGDTPLAGDGVLSGSRSWTRVAADLSALTGMARIRFRFVSDGSVSAEGFYLDDVAVVSRAYSASLEGLVDLGDAVEIEIGVVGGAFDGRGFNVYRRRDGARGSLEPGRVPPGFDLLNDAPLLPEVGAVTYVDTGAERGRAYYYLVEDLGPEGPAAPIFLGPERIYLCLGGPSAFLRESFPSPFRPDGSSTVTLLVGSPDPECSQRGSAVRAEIYDVMGRLVKRLPTVTLPSGIGELHWNGRDEDGDLVPSGVYLWRVRVQGKVLGAKILVVR
jgi:M6 family metalloprotease-like protein